MASSRECIELAGVTVLKSYLSGYAHHVIFLMGSVTSARLLSGMKPEPDVERITPAGRHIYCSVRSDAVSRSVLARVGRTPEYQHVTVRTISTLERMRKLAFESG